MEKQTSTFFFKTISDYIEKHFPAYDVQKIIDKINRKTPYYVENLKTGEVELVSKSHFDDENYWFSSAFLNDFSDAIINTIPDPDIFYKAGDSIYNTQNFFKNAIGLSCVGPRKMLTHMQRENDKYNRNKTTELIKSEKGYAQFRVIYDQGVVASPYGMQGGSGLLRAYIKLAGATDIQISHKWINKGPATPDDKEQAICEFEVTYKDPGFLKRIFKSILFQIPIVKKEIDNAEKILSEHKEQILNREKIIEEKTNALKEANEKLVALDKLKTEFFTNMTHELRTPLTLIKSQIEAIRQGHLGSSIENSSEIFDSVNRNVDVLARLIDSLLDFSKIESGKMSVSLETVCLSDLLRLTYLNFESAVHHRNIVFEYIDPPHEVYAFLDKDLFEKAIYNLLSNALKFTPSGGRIALSLEEKESDILISVKDTGIGIAKEHHEVIFQRFHQVDSSLNRKYEGTGVGLSLTKKIIDLHKGSVFVDSEPGKGSTFTIRLPKAEYSMDRKGMNGASISKIGENPLKETKNKAEPDNIEHESPGKAGSYSILIVEDNDDLRSFIRKLIDPQYNASTAKNGKEALSRLNDGGIDLVITDIMMPEMDGLELLKNIRQNQNYAWLPIIMLTARADFPMKMEGFSLGANDYIIKPFQPDELLARIKSQLSLVALRREYVAAKTKKTLTDNTIVAIEQIEAHLKSNFRDDISRESLSAIVDMSPDHLSRMFKKQVGLTIKDYVNALRIESTLEPLQNDGKKIIDIAFDAGFESLSSFNRAFKKLKGITPSEYRSNHLK